MSDAAPRTTELATLGGGCFWCLDAVYRELDGVQRVTSGYAGGDTPAPTYREVCGGRTGHAEVVQVEFDPAVISFRDLLDVFFTIHDPTQLDRQGADVGTQYRSVIFTHDEQQERVARGAIAAMEDAQVWDKPIVTAVQSLPPFFPAEAYHQDYYRNNPDQGYCQVVVAPKVAKARRKFFERLKVY